MQNKKEIKTIDINKDCQFLKDLNTSKNFGGTTMGLWNLAVCVGQVKMFSKGIKPSRHWRLKDVKNYFGISGNTETILTKLNHINKVVKGEI